MTIRNLFYTLVLEAVLFSLFGSVAVNSLPASATGACCFLAGGDTCDNHNPKQCPNIPGCETPSACTGAYSTQSKGTWCPGVTSGPGPGPSPPRNAADTGNVTQPFRLSSTSPNRCANRRNFEDYQRVPITLGGRPAVEARIYGFGCRSHTLTPIDPDSLKRSSPS